MSAEQTPDIETLAEWLYERGGGFLWRGETTWQDRYREQARQWFAYADMLDRFAVAVRDARVRELREVARDIEPRRHHCFRPQGCVECGRAKAHEAFIRFLNNRADRVAEPQHEAATSARVLLTQPHDGHDANETCPGCPHEAAISGKESEGA